MGLNLSHVNYFMIAEEDEFEERILKGIRRKFIVSKVEKDEFRFTGLDVKAGNGKIDVLIEDEKISDDPRNGGKMGVKLNQENVFGEVSIYNRVYQGLERLSKTAISGFSLLRETVSKISENIRDKESQDKNVELKGMVDKNVETRNDSSP